MAHVSITLEGRTFRITCEDEDAERLSALALELERRVASLQEQFGPVGDERLVVMAALLALDELWDLRESGGVARAGVGNRRARRKTSGHAANEAGDGETEENGEPQVA